MVLSGTATFHNLPKWCWRLSLQESPPAENHKRRTARAITCPTITYLGRGAVPHPDLARGATHPVLVRGYQSWPGQGVPCHGLPPPPTRTEVTPWDWGTLQDWDNPWEGTWDQLLGNPPPKGHGASGSIMEWRWGTPSGKDMGPVEVLWDGDGVPPAGHGQS